MTRKHFKAMADEIRYCTETKKTKLAMANMCIHVCRQFNPMFDSHRFMEACGFYERKES